MATMNKGELEFGIKDDVKWFDKDSIGLAPSYGIIVKVTPLLADISEPRTLRVVRVRKAQLNWS